MLGVRHHFSRHHVILLCKLVQVQTFRLGTCISPQEIIAVLGSAEGKSEFVAVQDEFVAGLDANCGFFVVCEGNVGLVGGVLGGFVHHALCDCTVLAEVGLGCQGFCIRCGLRQVYYVHELTLDYPGI